MSAALKAQQTGRVISFDLHCKDRRWPKTPRTILEIPYEHVITDLLDFICFAEWTGLLSDAQIKRIEQGGDITLRECALLYDFGRRNGYVVSTEAMPPVRGTSLVWIDQHERCFKGTFPITALLPFLAKGRS